MPRAVARRERGPRRARRAAPLGGALVHEQDVPVLRRRQRGDARSREGAERDEDRLRGVLVRVVRALLARHLDELREGDARLRDGVHESRGHRHALPARAQGGHHRLRRRGRGRGSREEPRDDERSRRRRGGGAGRGGARDEIWTHPARAGRGPRGRRRLILRREVLGVGVHRGVAAGGRVERRHRRARRGAARAGARARAGNGCMRETTTKLRKRARGSGRQLATKVIVGWLANTMIDDDALMTRSQSRTLKRPRTPSSSEVEPSEGRRSRRRSPPQDPLPSPRRFTSTSTAPPPRRSRSSAAPPRRFFPADSAPPKTIPRRPPRTPP